jgi:ADP-heptose:LPS heptosyltransferase
VRSPNWEYHMFVKSVQSPLKLGISGDFTNQSAQEDQSAASIYTQRYNVPPDRYRDHELSVTRDFLKFLGIPVDLEDLQPQVWTNQSDTDEARRLVPDNGLKKLGIVPGTAWPHKIYPPDGIVAAISALKNHRVSCYILGSSNEVNLCAELEAKLSTCPNVHEIVNLCGKTTVRTMTESLRLCDVVLSADSAPLHIATAIGKPTVGIMGGGHYGRFYPWGDPEINRVASLPTDCYWCNWKCKYDQVRCISEMAPETISLELRKILASAFPLSG